MKQIYSQLIVFIIVLFASHENCHGAKPKACAGVSKTCTTDVRFDKTIEGEIYSCYECKQVVCKSGGSGPIAGTETSTVCETKTPTGKALIRSQQEMKFDEADAIFGKRTEVKQTESKPSTSGSIRQPVKRSSSQRTIDHRNKDVSKNRNRGTRISVKNSINSPSKVTLYDVTNSQLKISWVDNDSTEYGVSVERGTPEKDRGGVNYNWQHVFNVEERIDSNVKGTGWRTDGDDGLASDTTYCYRLRAYHKSKFSAYSSISCTTTD